MYWFWFYLSVIGAVLVNNVVLVRILGLCPFMGVSKKLETAIGMGLATTFVMTLASACSYLMEHYILIPLDIAYLRTHPGSSSGPCDPIHTSAGRQVRSTILPR